MIEAEKYGYWKVGETKFFKKYDALVHATTTKDKVLFHYHDEVWKSFDRSQLGKNSLQQLYKERAQQLRDKYSYLVLYYSGGADSHNILKTFIDNNIKLDEVCIKWPKVLMDGNLYQVNNIDTSGKNYWSEWNYAIKPILEWLATNRPNIKIKIKDYADDISKLKMDSIFEKLNFIRGGGILLNSVVSDSDRLDNVAHIYGIDKPLLFKHNSKMYMFFSDVCLDQAGRSDINPNNTECFYWAPDFPALPFEMAYQLALYFKMNPDKQDFVWDVESLTSKRKNGITQFLTNLSRDLLYDNWDNRFQADKPNEARTDKFFWFYEHTELNLIKEKYMHNVNSRINMIGDELLTSSKNTLRFYEVCISKYFYVTDL